MSQYEQFLQVGRLNRALIFLGLAIFRNYGYILYVGAYIFSELSLVGLVLDLVD